MGPTLLHLHMAVNTPRGYKRNIHLNTEASSEEARRPQNFINHSLLQCFFVVYNVVKSICQ